MARSLATRLLGFARELQRAHDFRELLETTQREALEAVGYRHVWLFVADSDSDEIREVRLVDTAGTLRERVWEVAPVLKIKGDPMMEEVVHGDHPVIVLDARTDPRTDKSIVAQLGNRTIINIPLRLLDKPFGTFGVGTFADEGCRAPTPAQVDYLVGMASQLSVAAGRIRFLEERARATAEKQRLELHLFQLQKLESLGLMAGGIAHDFNNLLTIILLNAKLCLTKGKDAPPATLDAVVAAAEQGITLTRQLMAMSREEPIHLTPLGLNERLTQLLVLLRRVLPTNVKVGLEPDLSLSPLEADAAQLDQLFVNLCLNARDAMPDGGQITIATSLATLDSTFVTSHPWARPGRFARASVTDTGAGMPPEVLERIFEPLFSTRKDSGGTGLGLAVVYGIVQRHHGLVHCTSAVGRGTRFDVYFPLTDA